MRSWDRSPRATPFFLFSDGSFSCPLVTRGTIGSSPDHPNPPPPIPFSPPSYVCIGPGGAATSARALAGTPRVRVRCACAILSAARRRARPAVEDAVADLRVHQQHRLQGALPNAHRLGHPVLHLRAPQGDVTLATRRPRGVISSVRAPYRTPLGGAAARASGAKRGCVDLYGASPGCCVSTRGLALCAIAG